MKYEFEIIGPGQVKKYIRDFKTLEKKIEYPLEDGNGSFKIDHGLNYHTFFTQQGFKTRFAVIKKDEKITRNEKCLVTGKKFKHCCGAL